MIQFCKKCFLPSTRPNLGFNNEGVCSACQWSDLKKHVDWPRRQAYFKGLCEHYGKAIVPWSGGKDSIYVAYKMRDFGIDPLLITVLPDLETEIGAWNRKNVCKDFKKIEITVSEAKYRDRARECFIENGKVKHPWECAISALVLQQAIKEGYKFVVYGEEGGAEYGGWGGFERALNHWKEPIDIKYLKEYYFWGKEMFELPPNYDDLFFTQYSRFESWQSFKHADFAIGKGMRTIPVRSVGTFTCSAQISDTLQDLHAYILFVKFGFGRATADGCIALRDGWTDREEALEWIEAYDGEFNNAALPEFLEYLRMDKKEFDEVIAKHANREIVEQAAPCGTSAGHLWYLKSWICNLRRLGMPQQFISEHRFRVK